MMAERRTVVLYGDSVFMAGIESILADQPALDVIRKDAPFPEACQCRTSLHADIIIFDTNDARLDTLPSMTQLLIETPNIRVIGLDLKDNVMTVLCGRCQAGAAVEDLIEVIQVGEQIPEVCSL